MKDFNQQPWWAQSAIILVLIFGVMALWNSFNALKGKPRARAMTPEEVRDMMLKNEMRERAIYREQFGDEAADALPSLDHFKHPPAETPMQSH